ncbi:hypothetical protein [Pantoea agglomerans]|uniref:hypothetical protein n=1 Tax=Enterobacter agglomerans TaxID=549 RepID=UPI00301E13A5
MIINKILSKKVLNNFIGDFAMERSILMFRNAISLLKNSIKILITAAISFTLLACSSDTSYNPDSPPDELSVCTGFGCSKSPGKRPSSIDTHKATKNEKIRARRGESPDFGSEEWSVGGPIKF